MLIPFSYPWIFRYKLNDSVTILDVGCGDGDFMRIVNFDKKYQIIGVDLFKPYLNKAKKTGVYSKVVAQDIRKINFKKNEFDAVISSQVIEHLTKKDGFEHIKKLENYSSRVVIIGTPNGHFHQEGYDGNDLQEHHSQWIYKDFEKLGYKTYGQGLKYIYEEHGLLNTFLGKIYPIKILLFLISLLYQQLSC